METPSAQDLEKHLLETGTQLLHHPPSSVHELFPLLNRVLDSLRFVLQSPHQSMRAALSPLTKALVSEKLLKHSDADVKVAVAACINDITRIYAPTAPYDEDQMKEVFQLIVSSLENLSDKSSSTYAMATQILKTMADIDLPVEMLNLRCYKLFIAMFQHFLKTIRVDHPENVFSSMEIIMTRVLEETDDMHLDLLSPIVAYVKQDNKVSQISRKLAEQVLKNSATKVIPYLTEEVKTLTLKYQANAHNVMVADLGHKEKQKTEEKGKQPLSDSKKRNSPVKGKRLLETPKIERHMKRRACKKAAIVDVSSDSSSGDGARPSVSSVELAQRKGEEQSPKKSVKRKLDFGKEKAKAPEVQHYGENLVGLRIKVWWPLDAVFYDGVIEAYDADKKKHVVCYIDDNEKEVLNLKRQKWEIIDEESESSEDEDADKTFRGVTSRKP